VDRLDERALERAVKRIIVLGGLGQFGGTAAKELLALGVPFKVASRGGNADLQIDANDVKSIRSAIQPGDVVLDAAGPFTSRTTALIETAIDVGFDVIDINDDLRYAEAILRLAPRIDAAGIRVLSSASTVSAVTAAVVVHSGFVDPRRVTTFLAPATRHTANAGAALSLIGSVGRPVKVFHDGQFQPRIGWTDPRSFQMPPPLGIIRGRLFESADAVHLPRIWPLLRDVAMYVDPNTIGVNAVLRLAAHSSALRSFLGRQLRFATRIARTFGSVAGGIGYEIEDVAGYVARYAIVAGKNSFITAVAPAVLAAQSIVEDRFPHRGLVPPDRYVAPSDLFAFLQSRGVLFLPLAV
jgi:hypothetical protein